MKRQQRGHPSQLAGQDQAGPLGRRGPAEKDEQKGPGEGMAEPVAPTARSKNPEPDVLESFLSALLPRVRLFTSTPRHSRKAALLSIFANEQYSGSCFR